MSSYWDPAFMKHLQEEAITHIVEVGARYGDESIALSNTFPGATLYTFECNPLTVDICREKLRSYPKINFMNIGLGDKNEILPFYSYTANNDGASSLLKRIDAERTQRMTGEITIRTLHDVMEEHHIPKIDLLCMDIQGYELNVLKGCRERLKDIKFVIMEEPKPVIDLRYLPAGVHSKYVGAPTSQEIKEFMTVNGFVEIERIAENMIEDNVMYRRVV